MIWKGALSVKGLIKVQAYPFGKITNILKGFLQSMIKEDKPSGHSAIQEQEQSLPKNQKEAEKHYIANTQTISNLQQARMEKIDQALGTRTYYHQTKIYQQRLDSDHFMEIKELRRKFIEPDRDELDWSNPQAPPKFKVKDKKKYNKLLHHMRNYPQHHSEIANLGDENNATTIEFLGKESLYTKLSLASVDMTIESIENEQIDIEDEPLTTQKYTYFKAPYTTTIYRIDKDKYYSELASSVDKFAEQQAQCQEVVSLQYLYKTLKQYDQDERVEQYLKKVENNTIQYLVSGLILDSSEKELIVILDLTGQKKQYAAIYRNLLKNDHKSTASVLFNLKPKGLLKDRNFYYVRRSEEGLFIELMIWRTDTFQQHLVYRCAPHHQIEIFSDSKQQFTFIRQKQVGNNFNQQILLLDFKQDASKCSLTQILHFEECRYFLSTNEIGIVFAKFLPTYDNKMKFGQCEAYCTQLMVIPFKNDSELILGYDSWKQERTESFPISNVKTMRTVHDLDLSTRKTLFKCEETEFIKEVEIRKTHTVLNLAKLSVYNQNRLHFIPNKSAAKAHSLYLQGFPYKIIQGGCNYESQTLKFQLKTPLISTRYEYLIWKKELLETTEDKIHSETITVQSQHNPNLSIRVLCHQNFVKQKTSVIVYCPSMGESIDERVLRRVLNKGIMVIQPLGRGTSCIDADYFMQGTKANYLNYVQDLQDILRFVGSNMSTNISIYAKGGYSSLLVFLLNIKFPFLLNSVVLHNGLYDLSDSGMLNKYQMLFGKDTSSLEQWKSLNPLQLPFKSPKEAVQDMEIGILENVILSSDADNRIHSRKMIKHLRGNTLIKYMEVYLQEHEHHYKGDLCNLAFIYNRIRNSKHNP